MKLLQNIWAAWGILVFILFMFPALPIYIVAIIIWKGKAIQKVHWVSRLWARSIFFFIGIIPKNVGNYKPNKKQSHVLISNHQSALDIPLCAIASALPFRFLSKAELGKIPVLGWIIKNIYLTVDRGSNKARIKSMERMKAALIEGSSLFIYPEGTRNRSKEPTTRFFDGAFKLAIASKKPLGILVIENANELCPTTGFNLKPGIVRYKWIESINTSDYKEHELEELKSLAKEKMNASLIEMRDGTKA
ncbi:MAG: 1-acyl-sn-glycerol-3-phosphate acyltransferase [Bacteroidia bacterium]